MKGSAASSAKHGKARAAAPRKSVRAAVAKQVSSPVRKEPVRSPPARPATKPKRRADTPAPNNERRVTSKPSQTKSMPPEKLLHPKQAARPAAETATAKTTKAADPAKIPRPQLIKPAAVKAEPKLAGPGPKIEARARPEPGPQPEVSLSREARPERESSAAPEAGADEIPPGVAEVPAAASASVVEPALSRPQPPMPGAHNRPGSGPMPPRPSLPPRPLAKAEVFVEGDHVVYPTHGVGKVERIATEEIAGHKLELIHITFEENRMTLRVPVSKARTAGLRKLATRKSFDEALAVLRGRARIKRTMWSRRAQEYEAKINSGDPMAIAEVVRDLHRNAGQPDQSFSERQIYEAAMDRLAAELAALDQTDKLTAAQKLSDFLKTII